MRLILIALLMMNVGVFGYFKFTDNKTSESSPPLNAPVSNAPASAVRLLSSLNSPASSAVSSPANPTQQDSRPLCTLVGAFDKLLQAEYFVERLTALGLTAEIKNIVVANEPGYWLYLPPESSRKEALRRLSELHRLGIDSYVIPSGNLENGISLGMFARRESAESMKQRVSKQGYAPEVVNVPREQKEIWIFLPEGEAAKLTNQRWVELVSDQDYLQKRQNFCVDVAST